MKCLVSGATGFVGRHLCQRLLDRGDTVTALSRRGAPLPDGTPTLALELSDSMPEMGLLQGIDVAFLLAGIAHQRAPAQAYKALNENATVELARRCSDAGVSRFVFLSSVKAMGPSTGPGARSEHEGSEPTDPYGLSKWRAEQRLQAEFAAASMTVVILRPALVYGIPAKGNLALLAQGARAGLPRPPPLGARSMVALDDLVELLCEISRGPMSGAQLWNVTDGRNYSTRFIYDQLRAATGQKAGSSWLPVAVWRLAAALLDRLPGSRHEGTFDKLFGTERYSNKALLESTSWRPRVRFEQVAMDIMAGEELHS